MDARARRDECDDDDDDAGLSVNVPRSDSRNLNGWMSARDRGAGRE